MLGHLKKSWLLRSNHHFIRIIVIILSPMRLTRKGKQDWSAGKCSKCCLSCRVILMMQPTCCFSYTYLPVGGWRLSNVHAKVAKPENSWTTRPLNVGFAMDAQPGGGGPRMARSRQQRFESEFDTFLVANIQYQGTRLLCLIKVQTFI